MNPNATGTEIVTKEVTAAASTFGLQIEVVQASDTREVDSVFATLARHKTEALLVGPDAFFVSRRLQLAVLSDEEIHAGGIAACPREARDQTKPDRVFSDTEDNGDRCSRRLGRQGTSVASCGSDHHDRPPNQFGHQCIDIPATLLARADEVIE